jgi:hypothetical protein
MIVFTKLELEQGAQGILDFIQGNAYYSEYTIYEIFFILNAATVLLAQSVADKSSGMDNVDIVGDLVDN